MKAEKSLDTGFSFNGEDSATSTTSLLEHVSIVDISRNEHVGKSSLVESCFALAVMLYYEASFITDWIDPELVQLPFDVG